MSERSRADLIASRIADGERVDWASELAGGEGDTVLRNLRLLDGLSQALNDQAANQDSEQLLGHLDRTFDEWLEAHGHVAAIQLPKTWGKLQITGLGGTGAYADVFRALDPSLKREVALKLFRSKHPESQRRLLKEGRRLARVDHPNVLRIYGVDEFDGRVGLWMEFIKGKNLDEWISAHGLMSGPETKSLGVTLCGALSAVHKAGVLHRDIKAQNVMREEGGRIVLTDFGSGLDIPKADAEIPMSGTPLYLAPEVLAGGAPTVQSDVYSLGVLLFHMLTGDFPVSADTLEDLQKAHREDRRQGLRDLRPQLDEGLVAAIERATDAVPAERFRSMGEFARSLAGKERARRRFRLSRWRLAGLAAAAAAVSWLGLWLAPKVTDPIGSAPMAAFEVNAALYRIEGLDRKMLESGAMVRVGDMLALSFTASTNLYVYIFNEDERGHAHGLFPLPSLDQINPLTGGPAHMLPGTRGQGILAWQVDSPGGMESIHIVASPKPVPEFERLFDQLPPAGIANTLLGRRGIGTVGLVEADPIVSAAPLLQVAREYGGTPERHSGVWLQTIELVNEDR